MYFGKFRAIVKDINDPLKMGRIRVECKEVYSTNMSPWALPCFPPNMFTVPQLNDVVWIEFEGGITAKPIWTGCLYNKKELQGRFSAAYNSKAIIVISNQDVQIKAVDPITVTSSKEVNINVSGNTNIGDVKTNKIHASKDIQTDESLLYIKSCVDLDVNKS